MIVAVTGGREYDDLDRVFYTMDTIHREQGPIRMLVHGGATGADTLAAIWAAKNGVATRVFLPDWDKHGKAAGPIRNREMLKEARPALLVAFPGGRGTADCTRQAEGFGTFVYIIKEDETND